MPRPTLAATALPLTLLLLGSCGATTETATPTGAALLQDINPGGALAVHPVYASAFEAIEAALDADDLPVARATLSRLRSRLLNDQSSAPTLAAARNGNDEVSIRTASGELPARESVEAALKMAAGFERVIEGRVRLAAVDLRVELTRVPGSESVEVALVGDSEWTAPLLLRPGVARLEVLRTALEPRTGMERRASERVGLDEAIALEMPAGGTARAVVATVPIQVPKGAIATRMRVDVTFNGGSVAQEGVVYPARDVAARAARRTDLSGKLPATLLPPSELVQLVERGGAPLEAILERTVRIAPDRYEETLDLLGKSVATLPAQSLRSLVPALRWIVRTNQFGREEAEWRDWLIKRYDERVASGAIL